MEIKSGDRFGSYIIEMPLSQAGGMSQVFLARDINRHNYWAALKVHLANDNQSGVFQDLLRKETDVLKKLRHPGIVHIYPIQIDDRTSNYVACANYLPGSPWYFAMEYLGAYTLDKYIEQIGNYPVEWSIELFYQLLITIDYMHQRGYAHCDLKPQNIFLRYPPDPYVRPMPVLVDFGSATYIESGISQLSISMRYAAPEALAAHLHPHYDYLKRAIRPDKLDIWALGTILFEMLTGRPLIKDRSKDEITTTIIKNDLETITQVRRDHTISLGSLDRVLSQMVSKDPISRPTTTTLIRAVEERIMSVSPPRIPIPSRS